MATYDLTPVAVPAVATRYRTIRTKLPVPESLPVFEELARSEPRSTPWKDRRRSCWRAR